jgi:hypothetical protein
MQQSKHIPCETDANARRRHVVGAGRAQTQTGYSRYAAEQGQGRPCRMTSSPTPTMCIYHKHTLWGRLQKGSGLPVYRCLVHCAWATAARIRLAYYRGSLDVLARQRRPCLATGHADIALPDLIKASMHDTYSRKNISTSLGGFAVAGRNDILESGICLQGSRKRIRAASELHWLVKAESKATSQRTHLLVQRQTHGAHGCSTT